MDKYEEIVPILEQQTKKYIVIERNVLLANLKNAANEQKEKDAKIAEAQKAKVTDPHNPFWDSVFDELAKAIREQE